MHNTKKMIFYTRFNFIPLGPIGHLPRGANLLRCEFFIVSELILLNLNRSKSSTWGGAQRAEGEIMGTICN